MAEMTPQEAIEILQHERDWAQQPSYVEAALSIAVEAIEKQFQERNKALILAFDKDGKARVLNEDYTIYCADKETFEKVKEAVEKQIPKKPIKHGFNPLKLISTVSYTCPNCNRHISITPYCDKCGQALLWERSDNNGY